MTGNRDMPIGAASRASGVNIETIRYYERIGLMSPPPRTEGGRRAYDHNHVTRLRFVRRCRDLGFPLDDVRRLLDLADGRYPCAEVKRITLDHVAGIRAKIDDLVRMDRVLSDVADRCTGDVAPDCPILEALSR